MVECKYRGRVIGWLVTGKDGALKYLSHKNDWFVKDGLAIRFVEVRNPILWGGDEVWTTT